MTGSANLPVVDLENQEHFALKLEHVSVDPSILKDEAELYKLVGGLGIPRVKWFGYECEYRAMIFDLLGPNLEDLFNFCRRKFSLKTVLMLADQLIHRIQHVHSRGVIHRDIRPENLLMGIGRNGNMVYVTDLGISTEYGAATTGSDTAQQGYGPPVGTICFASINGHSGVGERYSRPTILQNMTLTFDVEQSHRDDMESLGYLLVYFIRGSLPWQGIRVEDVKMLDELVLRAKKETSVEELCDKLPKEFTSYFHHVRSLRFEEKPDYGYLRRIFRNLFTREGFEHDYVFDWTILKYLEKEQSSR